MQETAGRQGQRLNCFLTQQMKEITHHKRFCFLLTEIINYSNKLSNNGQMIDASRHIKLVSV